MTLSRRYAWVLFAIAAWNVVIWATFIKNLIADDGRPTGFYVAHSVLIVVDLLIAVVLALIGWRIWRTSAKGTADAQHQPTTPGPLG